MNNKGFTLLEMIVTIGIMVLLTGIVLINYQEGQKQLALQRAANKLAQDIRRVQEMAMSAQEYNGAIPAGGYGVYFIDSSPNSYILFADCTVPPNYVYNDTGNPCAGGFPEKIQEIELEKSIIIDNLSASPLDITFVPPDPTIYFNTATTSSLESIQLSVSSGQTKTIKVNGAGLITIE